MADLCSDQLPKCMAGLCSNKREKNVWRAYAATSGQNDPELLWRSQQTRELINTRKRLHKNNNKAWIAYCNSHLACELINTRYINSTRDIFSIIIFLLWRSKVFCPSSVHVLQYGTRYINSTRSIFSIMIILFIFYFGEVFFFFFTLEK